MNNKNIKQIMELIFIFILPLIFICFTSEIQVERNFEYDNEGNYQVSEDTKKLSFDNSIINYVNNDLSTISYSFTFNQLLNENYTQEHTKNNITSSFNGQLLELNINGVNASTDTIIIIDANNTSKILTLNHYYIVLFEETNGFSFSSDYNNTGNHNTCYLFNAVNNYFNLRASYNANVSINYESYLYLIDLSVWFNNNIPTDLLNDPSLFMSKYYISNDYHYSLGESKNSFSIWGNIRKLLIDNLDLNNNVLLDIVLCYMILWIINFIAWHFIYGFFELIVHLIPSPFDKR